MRRLVWCAAIAALFALAAFAFEQRLVYAYEDAMFALAPSASRAYGYGIRHFDAPESEEYDIDRAAAFFRKAANINPMLPGVQHQLARIEFLRGNFSEARAHIDREIGAYGGQNASAYYIRALIRGYEGDYLGAASDYEMYFSLTPANWAGINDYSWVLLKADLPEGALAALDWGLKEWPRNPWLLHNKVIALYELGRYREAAAVADEAAIAVETVTEDDWLVAYPGNDPKAAAQGLASFKAAVEANREKVREALAGNQ